MSLRDSRLLDSCPSDITAVTNAKTFEYELTGDPGVDSENEDVAVLGVKGIEYCQAGEAGLDSESEQFAAGYFGRIWQVRSLVIENNVIELGRHPFDSSSLAAAYAVGLRLYGTRFGPESSHQYSIVHLLARGNVIRNVEEIGDRGQNSKTIEMSGCESALLEQNIIDLPSARPLEHNSCGEHLQTFNNLTPGGTLVESFLQGSSAKAPEVTVRVRADLEDAMVASFLKSEED